MSNDNADRVRSSDRAGQPKKSRRNLIVLVVSGAVVFSSVAAVIELAILGGQRLPQSRRDVPAASIPKSGPDGRTSTSHSSTGSENAWANVGGGLQPAIPPSATPDTALDSVFESQLGPGWVGGDSTYSTVLPDGRLAFMFSDTLIGTARTDGSAAFTGMARSSELVGTLKHLVPDYGGSYTLPTALIPDSSNSTGVWETAATYTAGRNQLVFVNEFTGPTGILTMSSTGKSGIAVLSAAGGLPTFRSVTLIPTDNDTQWGSAIVQSRSFLYVYGAVMDRAAGHGVLG